MTPSPAPGVPPAVLTRPLATSINAILGKAGGIPVDLIVPLLNAVDDCAAECAARAVAAERERCAQLAERVKAHYMARGDDTPDGRPSGLEPFADLLREHP